MSCISDEEQHIRIFEDDDAQDDESHGLHACKYEFKDVQVLAVTSILSAHLNLNDNHVNFMLLRLIP